MDASMEKDQCCACLGELDDANRFFFRPCLHHALCSVCQEGLHSNICPVCRTPYANITLDLDFFRRMCHTGDTYRVRTLLEFHLMEEEEPDVLTDPEFVYHAALRGHVGLLQFFLEKGCHPDTSPRGISPLYIATQNRHVEIVKVLHEAGADMNIVTTGCYCRYSDNHEISCEKDGYTAFYVACEHGYMELILYFLDVAHIDPCVVHGIGHCLIASLECNKTMREPHATPLEVITLLLERGVDINQPDGNGQTVLYAACRDGLREEIKFLLEHGAKSLMIGPSSAMYQTCSCGMVDTVALLVEMGHVDVNQQCSKNGYYPLHAAATNVKNGVNITNYLLERGADPNILAQEYQDTPFLVACQYGNLEVARCYLERQTQIGIVDKEENTAFMIAVDGGHLEVVKHLWYLRDIHPSLDIHRPDKKGTVPLCQASDYPVVKFLLEKGFDSHHLDSVGNVFHYIVDRSKEDNSVLQRCLLCLQLLLQKVPQNDAPPWHFNQPNHNGNTPLMKSCSVGFLEGVKQLCRHGETKMGKDLMIKEMLQITNKQGYTPLHVAVQKNQIDIVHYFLEYGPIPVGINMVQENQWSPLHTACFKKHSEIAVALLESGGVEDIHVLTEKTDTPFIIACDVGLLEVVRCLVTMYEEKTIVQRIQELNYQNRRGYTGFHAACLRGRVEVVQYLLTECNRIGINWKLPNLEGHTPLHTVENKIIQVEESERECYLCIKELLVNGPWAVEAVPPSPPCDRDRNIDSGDTDSEV